MKGLNQITFSLLSILDAIRQLPPTGRGPDYRVWGPHKDDEHPGRRWKVEVQRHRDGDSVSYTWSIHLAPPLKEFVEIVRDGIVARPGD